MNCQNCNYPSHTNVTGVCKSCRQPLSAEVVIPQENKAPVSLKPVKKKSKAKASAKDVNVNIDISNILNGNKSK